MNDQWTPRMRDAWTPREPYVEPPRQQRKAVDLADVKVEPEAEAEKPAEGKPAEEPKTVSVADIDARLAGIEKSVAKLAKAVDKLAERIEEASSDDVLSAAWKKFARDGFEAAEQASRARQPLQDERYQLKPTDETAGGRISDKDYGFSGKAGYNADAERRLRS